MSQSTTLNLGQAPFGVGIGRVHKPQDVVYVSEGLSSASPVNGI